MYLGSLLMLTADFLNLTLLLFWRNAPESVTHRLAKPTCLNPASPKALVELVDLMGFSPFGQVSRQNRPGTTRIKLVIRTRAA